MRYLEMEYCQSYEQARYLESQSIGWIKFSIAFLTALILLAQFVVQSTTWWIESMDFLLVVAVVFLCSLLGIGLFNLYFQITFCINYKMHMKNIDSLYDSMNSPSYISKIRKTHPFWKGDTVNYFSFWDFWSLRILMISLINSLNLITILSFLLTKIEEEKMIFYGGIELLIIFICSVIIQFEIYTVTLKRYDKLDKNSYD